jgi:hypothetical protein
MQISLFEVLDDTWNYADKKVMIGLSGGINSAAVLVYLAEFVAEKPEVLHLFYAHFEEHSPDTERFVHELVEYARGKFTKIIFKQTFESVNAYFLKQNMIPHPTNSACTGHLKIFPMAHYMEENGIDVDLVGYVRSEKKRMDRQIKRGVKGKNYLIQHLSNEDCFSLVEKYFGWCPEIYGLKWQDKRIIPFLEEHKHLIPEAQYKVVLQYAVRGYNIMKHTYRVFDHNNCLPCKNMQSWQFYMVKCFFPEYYERALETAEKLDTYWGREVDNITKGDVGGASCTFCAFD